MAEHDHMAGAFGDDPLKELIEPSILRRRLRLAGRIVLVELAIQHHVAVRAHHERKVVLGGRVKSWWGKS